MTGVDPGRGEEEAPSDATRAGRSEAGSAGGGAAAGGSAGPAPDGRRRVGSGSPWEPVVGFSRAVRLGDTVRVAGTGPVWPAGACDPDPATQARRCFEIIAAALAALGSSLDDVVRTRLYVTDASHADAVGRAHAEAVGHVRPAATMVVVAGLLDPRWHVEIEAEAVVGD